MLLFTSAALAEPLSLTGPLTARLFVSSTANDTGACARAASRAMGGECGPADFTVKLTEVYPDGTSRLIQDGVVRMRCSALPLRCALSARVAASIRCVQMAQ